MQFTLPLLSYYWNLCIKSNIKHDAGTMVDYDQIISALAVFVI